MIYEEERTTDELVDEILGTGDGEHEGETEDAQDRDRWDIPGEGTERAACRRCGGTFLKPPGSRRTLCPACFSASVSAGMKAGHARRVEIREKRKAEAEAAKSAGPGTARPEAKAEGAGDMEKEPKTVQEAWDRLGEPEGDAPRPEGEALEKRPEEMTKDELRGKLAEGLRKSTGDVVLALYECIRDVARTAGVQTRTVLESMWEVDSILSHIGGV